MRTRGTGCIHKKGRSRFYWASFYIAGVHHNESTGTEDRAKAEAYLRTRIEVLTFPEGRPAPAGPEARLSDLERVLFEKTADSGYRDAEVLPALKKFRAFLGGDVLARDLGAEVLEDYRRARLEGRVHWVNDECYRPVQARYLEREMMVLRRLLRLGWQAGLLPRA